MASKARTGRLWRSVGVVGVCACVVGIWGPVGCRPPVSATTLDGKRAATRNELGRLAEMVVLCGLNADLDGRELMAFPQGDVDAAAAWVASSKSAGKDYRFFFGDVEASGSTLQDKFGRRFVYRFPAYSEGAMFSLYSTGPNGVDEHEGGDDITCAPRADFAEWRKYFEDPDADRSWLVDNYGHLQRNQRGRIVSAK